MSGARWRKDIEPPKHPTADLFHVADKHGVLGVMPDFKNGETWVELHEELHRIGEVKVPHEHGA